MIIIDKEECDFCGACVAICLENCIELTENTIEIDFKKCTECKLCVYICPIEVISHFDSEEL